MVKKCTLNLDANGIKVTGDRHDTSAVIKVPSKKTIEKEPSA